jgi:RNA polymerase primary sigma factor
MIDYLSDYLLEIGRYPLLTPAEEILLGHQIQEGIRLREKENPTKAEKRRILLGRRAEDKFINSNLRLVVSVAKRYTKRVQHFDLLDLIQEGNIGLKKAVDRFDPTRGYRFSTYAYWWIRQQITRSIGNGEHLIKLPGAVAELSRKIHASGKMELLEQGKAVTAQNLAELFDVDPKEIELILERGGRISSLDSTPKHGDDLSCLHELIADPSSKEDEPEFYSDEFEELITYVNDLDEREREVMEMFWGLKDDVRMNYSEIAKILGVGRERVRQIEHKARRKIKQKLNAMRSTTLVSRGQSQEIPRVLPQRRKVAFLSLGEQKRQNFEFRNSENRFL